MLPPEFSGMPHGQLQIGLHLNALSKLPESRLVPKPAKIDNAFLLKHVEYNTAGTKTSNSVLHPWTSRRFRDWNFQCNFRPNVFSDETILNYGGVMRYYSAPLNQVGS